MILRKTAAKTGKICLQQFFCKKNVDRRKESRYNRIRKSYTNITYGKEYINEA